MQRTWSDKGRRLEACKDGEIRKVKVPASLLAALRAQRETMALEGSVKDWTPEQRQLLFPTPAGQIMRHGHFYEHVWQPLMAKAGLPHRKRDPAQLRDVDARRRGGRAVGPGSELGHATIGQTVDSYTHLDGAKHEAGAGRSIGI